MMPTTTNTRPSSCTEVDVNTVFRSVSWAEASRVGHVLNINWCVEHIRQHLQCGKTSSENIQRCATEMMPSTMYKTHTTSSWQQTRICATTAIILILLLHLIYFGPVVKNHESPAMTVITMPSLQGILQTKPVTGVNPQLNCIIRTDICLAWRTYGSQSSIYRYDRDF